MPHKSPPEPPRLAWLGQHRREDVSTGERGSRKSGIRRGREGKGGERRGKRAEGNSGGGFATFASHNCNSIQSRAERSCYLPLLDLKLSKP